jgi:penicillin-binding protein 1B
VVTAATLLQDEPTTFYFDNRPYQPANFGGRFYGSVTLRQALAKSLNIPTVKLGEAIGFQNVLDLAKRAGMSMKVGATPAIALGAADATPLEVAGAYTMFDNRGVVSKPSWIKLIRAQNGTAIYEDTVERKPVLDPRVNYIMVDLMQEVMRTGTAAGVRSRGFKLPAAGKTGTSRDGWFAGFTSKLICVVWVGYDDGHDLNLEGAKAALPIWVEFMKRAHQHREYRNVAGWDAPDGVVTVDIDPLSGQLYTPSCPTSRAELFISGSQPVELCALHSSGATQVAGWETAPAPMPGQQTDFYKLQPNGRTPSVAVNSPVTPSPADSSAQSTAPPEPKKKGFFGRLKEIFR